MLDPVSIIGLAIQVGDIIWKIYEYGKEVKEWKTEVRALSEELFALKGVLEHMQQRYEFSQGDDLENGGVAQFMQSAEFLAMIRSTKEFLDDLFSRLTIPKDKVRKMVKALTWSLNKGEVLAHIERIGRVKAWFVMTMMNDNLDLSKETYHEVRELKSLLHREHESRTLERSEKLRKELIDWLAPVNPRGPHSKAFSRWQTGTGFWFMKGFFEEWFDSNHPSILWLRGKSGAGKTTLFSSAVEHALRRMQLNQESSVVFFYCSFDNAASQDPVNILASLVAQLAEKAPQILDVYKARYLSPDRPTVLELEDQIIDHSRTRDRLYIFIDAVNESSSSVSIIKSLSRIVQASKNVGILMTSTPEVGAQEMMQNWVKPVDMQKQRIENDITLFVNVRIQQSPTLRSISETIKLKIQRTVVQKADGMFRWVQCQMDFLAAQRTGKAVLKALEQLPDDLNSVYIRILTSILPADQPIAKEAFMWLSFSKRRLSLLELCEAVVIDEDDCSIDEDCRLRPHTALLSVCKGLITYDEDSGEAALAHSSIKAFLTSAKIKATEASFFAFDYQDASRSIIRKCLTYLMFDDFSGGCCDRNLLQDRFEQFHLLRYAALHWASHASQRRKPMYLMDEDDHNLVSDFLSTYASSTGGNFTHWALCLMHDREDRLIRATEPLYYMCSFNITSVVKGLLQKNSRLNIDTRGGRHKSTALQVSCVRSQTEIVQLLLEHGADPNTRNDEGLPCLYWAIAYRRPDAYKLLRQHGANPDFGAGFDDYLRDPRNKAVFSRSREVMEDEYQLEKRNRANEGKRLRRD